MGVREGPLPGYRQTDASVPFSGKQGSGYQRLFSKETVTQKTQS